MPRTRIAEETRNVASSQYSGVVRMYHCSLRLRFGRAHGGVINRNESQKLLTSSLEVASKVADERFELHKTMSPSGIITVLHVAQRSALEHDAEENSSEDVDLWILFKLAILVIKKNLKPLTLIHNSLSYTHTRMAKTETQRIFLNRPIQFAS